MYDILPWAVLTVILCASFGPTEAIKKDIVFLMDTSGSIANSEVLQAVDFIYNITQWLTIGPDDIRLSVVTFDRIYDEKFKLKDYNTTAELLPNLKRLAYSKPGGGTQTGAALEFVRLNSFLPINGGRPDANRTVVLLTDGQSSFPNKTLTLAELLKTIPNTEIFTIGIGSALSESNGEIRGISSDPDSYYVQEVDAFIYLCNVVPALVPKLDPLSKVRAILNCPTPMTTTPNPSSGFLGWRSSTTTKTTTRATPHQQTVTMSSDEMMTSRDVNDSHTAGKDIVFLMDTSGSIADSDVLQAVDFIYNVTQWLTIGPDDIRVSVVTFDSTYDEKFKLKDYNSMAELLPNLKRLAYSKPDGGTQTGAALEFVRLNSFLPINGGRPDANRTVVLLTDGQSSFPNETLTQAELLKSVPNTEIFIIGIGSALSESNGDIRGISSDPDSYYVQEVDAFIYLCNVVPALVPKLDPLSKARAILNCPTPTTTTPNSSSGLLGWRLSTTTKTTTRATPHQLTGAMSSDEMVTSRDVIDSHTERKDIVFLMDTSGSIADSDVLQAVDFIYNITQWLTIGPDDIRVSVVTFDSNYDEKFKLKDYNSTAELLPNLKRLAYSKPDGGTKTGAALEFVRLNSFLPINGGRLDANRTVVLLTDGQSSFPNKTLTQAELLKSVPNTEIFTIGIGSALSESNGEIRGISSDPDSYYVQQVDAFIYLCNVVPALVPKLDPFINVRAILNCPTPATTTSGPSSGLLGRRSSTTSPISQYQQINTTRATLHHGQQTGVMSSADLLTSRDVKDSQTEGKVDIALIVGVVLAGLLVLAAIGGGVIWWKRAYQVSPSKAGLSDVPWMRQYNDSKEGQLNTKFNPASLR